MCRQKYTYDAVCDPMRDDIIDYDKYVVICKYRSGDKERYSDGSLQSALCFVGRPRLIFKLHVWGTKRR